MPPLETGPPARAVLRLAGVLTQLLSASCLLLGTIAFVLIQHNTSGGSGYVVLWAVAAMTGLVFGGLMPRGSLIAVIGAVVVDAGFAIALFVIDNEILGGVLRVLPASDIDMIGHALTGTAVAIAVVAVLCAIAIPQALRYARWIVRDRELVGPGSTLPGVTGTMPAQTTTLAHGPPPRRPEPPRAGSTNKGWAPPTARISVWRLPPAAPEEARSRRRMYIALAGFAIGFGAGIGVLVSAAARDRTGPKVSMQAVAGSGSAVGSAIDTVAPDAAVVGVAPVGSDHGPIGEGGSAEDRKPIAALVAAQREALAKRDIKAVVATLHPMVFGFGIDADEIVEGRSVVQAQLERDLGELPADGFTVDSKFEAIGEQANHAWIAMELEISAPGQAPRRIAITELAAQLDNQWTVIAWHWAIPVPDATAERLAILNTLPKPKLIANAIDAPKELETAVRAAFGSRAGFAEARSDRVEGFNFGSAPGERITGGAAVKRVFDRLKAEIRIHDGLRVVGGAAWDPAQKAVPFIGYAAVNVDFTAKTRAATELTQTFRVLAVFVKEPRGWKIVQTQWSHGGPIR